MSGIGHDWTLYSVIVAGGWRCSCVPSVISVARLFQEERPVMNLVTSKPLGESFRRFVGLSRKSSGKNESVDRDGLFEVSVQA